MKLATYRDSSRDGQLVVVSRDLSSAHYASGIATRLQQLLDDWNFIAPQLDELSVTLNHGRARHAFPFDPRLCMAPLPRAFQWVEGSAQQSPDGPPAMRQGAADAFLGAGDDIVGADGAEGIDFAGQLAVVTGDIERGASPEAALEGVRLLMLANAVILREREAAELAGGAGLLQSRPATACAPVAVTPDELGAAWQGGRVHLNLDSAWNGKRVGLIDIAAAMTWHFGQLVAHVVATRPILAGSIVGSGALGSADASRGFGSIAEKRAREVADHGQAKTAWLAEGDSVRIEVKGSDGQSVFGAIEQRVRFA